MVLIFNYLTERQQCYQILRKIFFNKQISFYPKNNSINKKSAKISNNLDLPKVTKITHNLDLSKANKMSSLRQPFKNQL